MRCVISPVVPGTPHSLFESFIGALDDPSNRNPEIRGAFAYATRAGVHQFLSQLGAATRWDSAKKRLLVGLHNAITEPEALCTLRAVGRAQVRAFVPRRSLTLESLTIVPVFHPKVLALVTRDGLTAIQAGSPNLTYAAIGRMPKNYELAITTVTTNAYSLDYEEGFEQWWQGLWRASRVVNEAFIHQYARLREQALNDNPILRATIESETIETPETAKNALHFFLEVGAASGATNARNQVEFPRALAEFFGDLSYQRRDLILRQTNQVWEHRPLSYKQTSYGVDIWRLNMPTKASGGPPIAERAIRFTRTEEPTTFAFEVEDIDSSAFQTWKGAAEASGLLGATQGQRPRTYGFY